MTRQTYTDGQQNKLKLQEKTHKHKTAWQTIKKGESNKNPPPKKKKKKPPTNKQTNTPNKPTNTNKIQDETRRDETRRDETKNKTIQQLQ